MNDEYLAVTELDKFAKIYCRKKEQEKDRIECAIRHIESSLDVDPWARDIAVDAMQKQIPKKPNMIQDKYNANLWHLYCPSCENRIGMWSSRLKRGDMHNISNRNICPYCGRVIDCTGVGE